jgi:hypothetical protein
MILAIIIIRLYLGLGAAPSGFPDHRIGIRVVDEVGESYDRQTSKEFVPRGNTYIRLLQQVQNGRPVLYHSTFDVGLYEPSRSADALSEMHQLGYNLVRVFLTHAALRAADGGLTQPLLANLVVILKLAAQSEVHVILTQDWLPGGKYGDLLNQDCCARGSQRQVFHRPGWTGCDRLDLGAGDSSGSLSFGAAWLARAACADRTARGP